MNTHNTIKRALVAVAVTFGLITLSGCTSSDTNDNTKNDVVSAAGSDETTSVEMIKPDRTFFVGDTYDDGYLLVYTSLEVRDGMDVIVIELDNSERDANFMLEHWFLVTTSGRIEAFMPLDGDASKGIVYVPTLQPGETYAVQFQPWGSYAAIFNQPGM